MSYKHNNLMAMRLNYWSDELSDQVIHEKITLQSILCDNGIFNNATIEDAKYLFFSLPSHIIVKGFAKGFDDESVKSLISLFIQKNKTALICRSTLKIQYQFDV